MVLQVPAAVELLDAWERGLGTDAPRQALLLLGVLCRDTPAGELEALPVGQRNHLLLQARVLLFGEVCDTVADCPECGAKLEAALPVQELLTAEKLAAVTPTGELETGEYDVRYRVPTAADLIATMRGPVEEAARMILGRCVLSVRNGSRELSWTELPEQMIRHLEEAVAKDDPDAVLEVELTCPSCGQTVALPLDPASLLWEEIEAWAGKTVSDVHKLAAAYGWEEHHILAMSPRRRQTYLALCGVGGGSS